MAATKAHYAERRAANRASAAGYVYDPNFQSALEVAAETRAQEYETRWRKGGAGFLVAYKDLLVNEQANATAAEFVRAKIRDTVHDPQLAEALVPQGFPIGARRLCLDSQYFETFNRDNVSLVNLQHEPIVRIEREGLRTRRALYPLDVLIFATGFDAMTGQLLAIDIRGRAGLSLREKWADGVRSYLGLGVAGFPNLMIVAGPGSPSVLSNMVLSIEQHVEWIGECLRHLDAQGLRTIEATADSEHAWTTQLNALAERTLYPKVRSWYTGANIEGKPRVFTPYVGGAHKYRELCEQIARDGYRGFVLT
jgi:cyclohexanone monooxygenase